jgi:hypothetical protein
MTLSASDRVRLASLGPHTRRHAEQLIWEVGAPLRVSSAKRTARRNRAVGGSPTSFHLRGRAVDLTGDRDTLVRAAGLAWALRVGKGCTGPEEVILEGLGTPNQHLHVAW